MGVWLRFTVFKFWFGMNNQRLTDLLKTTNNFWERKPLKYLSRLLDRTSIWFEKSQLALDKFPCWCEKAARGLTLLLASYQEGKANNTISASIIYWNYHMHYHRRNRENCNGTYSKTNKTKTAIPQWARFTVR